MMRALAVPPKCTPARHAEGSTSPRGNGRGCRPLPPLNRLPLEAEARRNALVSVVQRKGALSLMSADVSSAAVTSKTMAGPPEPSKTQEGRGLVYDPDNDRYLYFDHRVRNMPTR
jgi:hypothetical protein